jgi:hypothetical protein
MKPVAVGLSALLALGCSGGEGGSEPMGQAGSGAHAGDAAGGTAGSGGSSSGSGNLAGNKANGGTGGKAGGGQGGVPSASMGQVHLLVDDIQDYGEATGSVTAGLDAEEFCADGPKPEGTLMRSPGTGRYFVCLSSLSTSASAALLDAEPAAPRAGYALSAALFHFEDSAKPNPNPGAEGPTNYGLVMLELNEFNGRSQCKSSNATLTGFKDVGRQMLLDGDSVCSTGTATYLENDKRWVTVQAGGAALTFELEVVASGN